MIHLHYVPQVVKLIETENRIVVARVWGERGPVSVVRGPREEAGWGWQCDLSLGLCTAPSLEAHLAFGSTKLLV